MIKKVFLGTILVGAFLSTIYIDRNYVIEGTIINEHSVEDTSGEVWEMNDIIPYRNGSTVKIHFNDNCTPEIRKDDIITKISLKK